MVQGNANNYVRSLGLVLAVLLVGLLGLQRAQATSLAVTTTDDSGPGSLRQVISDANPGDTITFDAGLGGQTITLASELSIDKNVSIDGSGLGTQVTISGNNAVRVFNIGSGFTVQINDLAIVDGSALPDEVGCPAYCGGAVIVGSGSTLTLSDITIANSKAGFRGGALYSEGIVTLVNSTFTGNEAGYQGGGAFSAATLVIEGSELSFNSTVHSSGGGIHSNGALTMTNTAIYSNTTGAAGGGIFISDGYARIASSEFAYNTATTEGGAIRSFSSTVEIVDTYVHNNAAGTGGGLYSNMTTLAVHGTTIADNSATGTFGLGGGIVNFSSLAISNSTIFGNSAYEGGGINNQPSGTLLLENSTIASNSANNQGAGILNMGEIVINHVIIADSQGAADCTNLGTIAANEYSLIEDNTCTPIVSGDPNLGSLANNGGQTLTLGLNAGSAAIDAGHMTDCQPRDQRGLSRPQGSACDIGAFEVAVSAALATNYPNGEPGSYFNILGFGYPTDSPATVTINGNLLGQTVTDANGNLSLIISTSDADEGTYIVEVSVNPSAAVIIQVWAGFPARLKEGSGPVLDVPAGIALSEQLYLPAIAR